MSDNAVGVLGGVVGGMFPLAGNQNLVRQAVLGRVEQRCLGETHEVDNIRFREQAGHPLQQGAFARTAPASGDDCQGVVKQPGREGEVYQQGVAFLAHYSYRLQVTARDPINSDSCVTSGMTKLRTGTSIILLSGEVEPDGMAAIIGAKCVWPWPFGGGDGGMVDLVRGEIGMSSFLSRVEPSAGVAPGRWRFRGNVASLLRPRLTAGPLAGQQRL